jgi:2-polyprenyl-3-methyl-5-hydroxy-6-metoxy-1,4-benzoquinol methylase
VNGDRERWNEKWRARAGELVPPSSFVLAASDLLPTRGRALDVAGGAGRHAVWLARRGLDVTMVDVSDAGLDRASARAASAGLTMRFLRADLDADELPGGAWDVILVHHFLCRSLWPALAAALAPDGLLLLCQPTRHNLERHPSPGLRFLVEPDEMAGFARSAGLEVVHERTGWTDDGRHEAELVARRIT